jgi:hypothetical protein
VLDIKPVLDDVSANADRFANANARRDAVRRIVA